MAESTHEVARARAALHAPGSAPDTTLLGAVHHGLLSVPVEPPARTISAQGVAARDEESAQLASRRRGV